MRCVLALAISLAWCGFWVRPVGWPDLAGVGPACAAVPPAPGCDPDRQEQERGLEGAAPGVLPPILPAGPADPWLLRGGPPDGARS